MNDLPTAWITSSFVISVMPTSPRIIKKLVECKNMFRGRLSCCQTKLGPIYFGRNILYFDKKLYFDLDIKSNFELMLKKAYKNPALDNAYVDQLAEIISGGETDRPKKKALQPDAN